MSLNCAVINPEMSTIEAAADVAKPMERTCHRRLGSHVFLDFMEGGNSPYGDAEIPEDMEITVAKTVSSPLASKAESDGGNTALDLPFAYVTIGEMDPEDLRKSKGRPSFPSTGTLASRSASPALQGVQMRDFLFKWRPQYKRHHFSRPKRRFLNDRELR